MSKKLLLTLLSFSGLLGFSTASAQYNGKEYDLDEIVVTATKMNLPLKEVPQKVEIIDRKKIESIPAETLAELLKKVSPLDIIQYPGSSSAIGIRGFAPSAHNRNYSVVLIDGKPAGSTNLSAMPVDFVERVEIVKGPYSVLYGSDAMGGVINIITRRPSEERSGAVTLGAGSFGTTHLAAYGTGGLGRHTRLSLGFSRNAESKDYKIGSNHLLGMTDTEMNILDRKSFGDVMDHTKHSVNQFTGMLDFDLSRLWTANVTASYVLSEGIEMPGNYWHSYGMSTMDFNRLNVGFDLKRTTRRNVLTFSPYFTDYLENNYPKSSSATDNFISDKNRSRQYGFKLYDTQRWGDFTLLAGVDLDGSRVSSERFSALATPDNPFRPDYNALSAAAYLQGAYTLNNLSVNAGVRYTFSHLVIEADKRLSSEAKSENYSNVSPSIGIKYFILPSLNVHGSFGTAFYLPDAYQTAGQFTAGGKNYKGNPDLKAETSLSYDLGINFNQGRLLNVDLTYFQTFYRNKIVTDYSNKDFRTFMNANNGRINGLEVMFSTDLAALFAPRHTLELYASYTHLFTDEFDTGTGENVVTKSLVGVRKDTGSFGINYEDGRNFSARLNARLIGHHLENDWYAWTPELRPGIGEKDYYTEGGYTAKDKILRHPLHLVFDYSAQYRVTRSFKVGITVSNLLDDNYAEKDGYNMPGRTVMGEVTYSF